MNSDLLWLLFLRDHWYVESRRERGQGNTGSQRKTSVDIFGTDAKDGDPEELRSSKDAEGRDNRFSAHLDVEISV